MRSILIPVYNFNCVTLVKELHEQCKLAGITFEIIILEDASTQFLEPNSYLQQLGDFVKYDCLAQNIGRSSIRNLLAQKAQYPYLLFMDCDSAVVKNDYITSYTKVLNSRKLLYGGRVYKDVPPKQKTLSLHWKFGRKREQSLAKSRATHPYHSFMTNNFVIPKAIFQQIKFDENLTQYGHEDTLFGMELKARNIPILHLDNPLEHIGLEAVSYTHLTLPTKRIV